MNILCTLGAEKLVFHLHKHNIPIAIASGGAQDSFELKTTNHKELMSKFSHVVLASTDPEVKNGKPAPDVFLVCANRFPDTPKPEQVSEDESVLFLSLSIKILYEVCSRFTLYSFILPPLTYTKKHEWFFFFLSCPTFWHSKSLDFPKSCYIKFYS